MSADEWTTWRVAWQRALYGPGGFYRSQRPVDHFRTSVHASPLFARAMIALVRRLGVDAVTDVGAGAGELLAQLSQQAPDLKLAGIELRSRPDNLPRQVRWLDDAPDHVGGLLVANELLDNVPCDVVELDQDGVLRMVDVRQGAGPLQERLGEEAPADVQAWVARWWPVTRPGDRVEVGLERDGFWRDLCQRLGDGAALAVDYGHRRDARPPGGTLASYSLGRQTDVRLDGEHDVTAHVAVDSLAACVGAEVRSQREMLHDLGVSGRRPPLSLATTDPKAYVQALSTATQAAELTESPGLGDFHWVLSTHSTGPTRP